MVKCKYCGVDGPYENCANSDDWPIIVVCYRRQLAAANERAGRLEEALEHLIVYAKDSVDLRYGTLSAEMVRKLCEKALEVPDAL